MTDTGALQRTAILVLLKERQSHGYELLSRMGELHVRPPDSGALYRELRAMEKEGVLCSTWHRAERGPARRVYRLTLPGHHALRRTLDELIDRRQAISELVDRYRAQVCRAL